MTDHSIPALDTELNRLRLELQTLKAEEEGRRGEQITVGSYLLARLEQVGVTVRP